MTPCGTVGYTAPEIVKDERYSMGVDMWALGCVLYTMLCGFPPFYDENVQILTEKVARGQYSFLSPWWDDISAEAKDLITHLLKVDPRERYTIREFLAHPWIRAGDEELRQAKMQAAHAHLSTLETTQDAADASASSPLPDSPSAIPGVRTQQRRRLLDVPVTPLETTEGAFAMKAAFEVSYAARRRRDASAQRRQVRQAAKANQGAITNRAIFRHAVEQRLEDRLGPAEMTLEQELALAAASDHASANDESITSGIQTMHLTDSSSSSRTVAPQVDTNYDDVYHQQYHTSPYYNSNDSDTLSSEDEERPMVVQAVELEEELLRHRHEANNNHHHTQQEEEEDIMQKQALAATLASARRALPNTTSAGKGVLLSNSVAANIVPPTSGSRRTRKTRGTFELKLDNATLLRRRHVAA
jgi:serine/threonine protein kinase